MRTLLYTLVASLLTAAPASSQESETAEPLYQVEVVVFRYADQSRNTPEIPRLVEPEIEDVLDQQLARLSVEPQRSTAGGLTGADMSISEQPPFWRRADPANGFLSRDAGTLRRLGAYEVLAHLAWVQSADDVSIAEAIDAADLGSRGFNGSLKLYRKRYVHLAVDLELGSAADAGMGPSIGMGLSAAEARPAIVDSRRMRLGRTIYFDQPQFGVLATVNRIDEPEAG